MSDSSRSDALAATQRENRQDRLEAIKRWVEYMETNPPSVWGDEQNRLIDAQVAAARESDLSPAHRKRVAAFGDAMTAGDCDESATEPE
jgi:septal ring factor EnvC (AmiA/AmiB activator)